MVEIPAFSGAADRNKEVILTQLERWLTEGSRVLEIASGTGQHCDYFTEKMPGIFWQPTDRDLEVYGLSAKLSEISRDNLLPPFVIDIQHWPNLRPRYDAVYSANCIHIAGWNLAEPYISGAARSLNPGGLMMLYGPFKYGGNFTTDSNADFDAFLKRQDPESGIRDFEAVDALANANGLTLLEDHPMPANNQFIVWQKASHSS